MPLATDISDIVSEGSLSSLFGPAVVFVAVSILFFWFARKYATKIDQVLAASRFNRGAMYLVGVIILSLICGAWADLIDVTKIFSGKVVDTDVWKLYGLAVLVPAFVTANLIWWIHGDRWENRVRAANVERDRERELKEEARAQKEFVLQLSQAFVEVVGFRADRVRKHLATQRGDGEPSQNLGDALAPSEQIIRLVEATRRIYERSLISADTMLRAVLYRQKDSVLEPILAWDGITRDCIKTPKNDLHTYMNLESPTKSLVVWAAVRGITEIVECAEDAHNDRDCAFRFFSEAQRHRIDSMMAIVLPNPNPQGPKFVLTLDTNQARFFRECDRWKADLVSRHLTGRLFLETDVAQILKCDDSHEEGLR